ncbi:MAG: flippase [Lachnospiraceae bacterium]|nr:flippase [Lachnospiraceae bacterium]
MSRNKSLALNAALNTVKTVLGILFPLITYPYVSRVLGVENLGIYNFSFSFLSYFLLIAALGVPTYGIREGTNYRDNKEQLQGFVSELFSINVISTTVSYTLLIILLYAIPFMRPYRTTILILSAEILFTTLGTSWVYNVFEDFLAIAIRTVFFQLLSLVFVFLFVKTSNDLYNYVLILLISNSGANLVNFFYIRKKYCKFYFTLRIDWKRHLRPIMTIFSAAVAITVFVSSDTTMLGFMTNDYQVGLYGVAVKIYTIIKSVLAAILMVFIPRFTLMLSGKRENETNEFFSRVFNVLTVLVLPMCFGLFLLSEDVVLVVSGKEYYGAAAPLRILSLAEVFSLFAGMYTQCVLIPLKKEKIVFRATAISAVVNIVLNILLIPLWGICAAAVTTVISEFIAFVIAYVYSIDTIRLVNVWKNLASALLGCAGIVVVCIACRGIGLIVPRVVISVIGSVAIYVIALALSKNPVLRLFFAKLFRR